MRENIGPSSPRNKYFFQEVPFDFFVVWPAVLRLLPSGLPYDLYLFFGCLAAWLPCLSLVHAAVLCPASLPTLSPRPSVLVPVLLLLCAVLVQ